MITMLGLYVCALLPFTATAFHAINCAGTSVQVLDVHYAVSNAFQRGNIDDMREVEGCVRALPPPHGLRAFLLHDCEGEGQMVVLSASDVEVGGLHGHRVRLHASPHGLPGGPPLLLLDPDLSVQDALHVCEDPVEQLSSDVHSWRRKLRGDDEDEGYILGEQRGYSQPGYNPFDNPHSVALNHGDAHAKDRHGYDLADRKLRWLTRDYDVSNSGANDLKSNPATF